MTYTTIEPNKDLIRSLGILRGEEPKVQLLLCCITEGPAGVKVFARCIHRENAAVGFPYIPVDVRECSAVDEILYALVSDF